MMKLQFQPFPVITTQRLVLRDARLTDAAALYRLRSNPEVMKYLDRPLAKSVGEAEAFIQRIIDAAAKNEGITWAMTSTGTDGLIGTIGFWKIDQEHYRGEIGYLMDPAFQGRGLMQEAMVEVISYGFDTMKLHSIEANVNPANVASIRLLERMRFDREAYFKENYYYDGKFIDSAIYSLLNKS